MSGEEAISGDKEENHNKVIRSKKEEPRGGMAANIPVATGQSGFLPSQKTSRLVISLLTHMPVHYLGHLACFPFSSCYLAPPSAFPHTLSSYRAGHELRTSTPHTPSPTHPLTSLPISPLVICRGELWLLPVPFPKPLVDDHRAGSAYLKKSAQAQSSGLDVEPRHATPRSPRGQTSPGSCLLCGPGVLLSVVRHKLPPAS